MGSILSRALFRETLKTFAAAFVAFAFIFLVAALYELMNHGSSGRQIGLIAPYVIIYTLPFLLPVAILVGTSLSYGRLAADNEIVAVASGGLPMTTLVRPALFLGALASCALYGLEGSVIPLAWLKKKDVARAFIQDLADLGTGENRMISSGDSYHFFFRRHDVSEVEGVEIVYSPTGDGDALLISGVSDGGPGDRPVEIHAERGRLEQDPATDSLRLELWDVTLTQFEAPRGAARGGVSQALVSRAELPPRGAPNQASFARLSVAIPIPRKLKDRTEYRASVYLEALRPRLDAFAAFTSDGEAAARASLARSLALAGALAVPGAGPAGTDAALAGLAVANPGTHATILLREQLRDLRAYLAERRTLSLGPLLFALVGALVPLRLQHNNRLVPFIAALGVVAVTFFLPFLTARNLISPALGADPLLFWIAPAATAAAALLLALDVRRR